MLDKIKMIVEDLESLTERLKEIISEDKKFSLTNKKNAKKSGKCLKNIPGRK